MTNTAEANKEQRILSYEDVVSRLVEQARHLENQLPSYLFHSRSRAFSKANLRREREQLRGALSFTAALIDRRWGEDEQRLYVLSVLRQADYLINKKST